MALQATPARLSLWRRVRRPQGWITVVADGGEVAINGHNQGNPQDTVGGGAEDQGNRDFVEAIFDSVTDGICVIDAETFQIISANRAFLATLGRREDEAVGRRCFEVTHQLSHPCAGPSEFCPLAETVRSGAVARAEHQHYDREGRSVHVEITTSPLVSTDGHVSRVVHTSHDITERKLNEERTQRYIHELAVAYDTTLKGWVRALDLRHHETEGHTRRVTLMTVRLGRSLGLSEPELVHVRRGALLHDIGKTAIPDGILLKPGPLTPEEMEVMQRHPVYAYEFLSPIEFLAPALDIPYCHHERWDGTGYPRGLQGTEIPLTARIFAIVDRLGCPALRPALPGCLAGGRGPGPFTGRLGEALRPSGGREIPGAS